MTNMQIVKVVVRGKLPENCWDCDMMVKSMEGIWHVCAGLGRISDEPALAYKWVGNMQEARPTWCPLELEPEKEDEDV